MHTDHSRVPFIISVDNAFSHQGIADRCVQKICKFPHFPVSLGDHCAAAHINKGFFRILQKLYSLGKFLLRIPCCRFGLRRLFFLIIAAVCRHIFRDIHKNRAGSAALCNGKGVSERIRQNRYILYDIIMLGNRHGDSRNVHLLKGILSQKRQIHVTGNRHHRHRIHISRCNTRYQIGRPRAAGRQTDSRFSCGSGITVRRMSSSLLMRRQNMINLAAVLIQRVIYIQNRTAGIAEHCVDSLLFETFHYYLRTCQYHVFLHSD